MLKTKKLKGKREKIQAPKVFQKKKHDTEEQISDLCSTCDHQGNCTLSATTSTIHYCEEFSNSTTQYRHLPVPPSTVEETTITNDHHMGLCVNCLHRDTCSLSIKEGGIWHCEEYE